MVTMDAFQGLADSWKLALKADGKSDKTLDGYLAGVRQLAAWLRTQDTRDDIDVLTPDLLRRWILSMAGKAESTVHTRYKAAKLFLDWCVNEGETEHSPMDKVNPPTIHETTTDMLTPEQAKALLATCKGKGFTARRDLALILLFMDTGCRLSEVVNLTLDDVSLADRRASVMGKGRRPRVVPFGARTARELDRYIRQRRHESYAYSKWLWLGSTGKGRLTTNGVQQMLRRRGQGLGINVHPHMFRHGFADAWLAAGGSEGDLMELAGWRSRQMLTRYAAANRSQRAHSAYDRMSPVDNLD